MSKRMLARAGGLAILVGVTATTPAAAESNMLFILDGSNSMWGQVNQTSEFLVAHGFIDRIVSRDKLKSEIARTIDYCGK